MRSIVLKLMQGEVHVHGDVIQTVLHFHRKLLIADFNDLKARQNDDQQGEEEIIEKEDPTILKLKLAYVHLLHAIMQFFPYKDVRKRTFILPTNASTKSWLIMVTLFQGENMN